MERYQRVYAQIDLDAIVFNTEQIKKRLQPGTRLMAVIKANGYGHGSIPIAKELQEKDYIYGFGVATAEEAWILRKNGITLPILVLGYTFPYCYEAFATEEIRPTLFREDTITAMGEAARQIGKPIKVHIKVDTGMSRIGIRPDESGLEFIKKASMEKGIEIEGIFTHLARADEADKSFAKEQIRCFQSFLEQVATELEISIPIKHCLNSAGIIGLAEAGMEVVRPGIITYGLYPSKEVGRDAMELQPALSLYSHIVYVKELEAGREISYGGTYKTREPRKVATIPVGYGDGYPRSLSGKGWVLIRGKKAPILGRVCMDQFMVDVTHIPEASEGDRVTLLGRDGEETLTAEVLGELSGRFNYELVCDLGERIPRVYKKGGKITATRDYYDDYR